MAKTVAVMTGSLREASLNRKLTRVLERRAEGKLIFDHVAIGDLPFYNDDLWAAPPEPVTRMKQQVEAADGVIIVTPEYNRSFPGLIKNALDWGSRPSGESSWIGKPGACIGTSPGAISTAVAQAHLRLAMLSVGMKVMHLPEVYTQWVDTRFGADGAVTDPKTGQILDGWIDSFVSWIG